MKMGRIMAGLDDHLFILNIIASYFMHNTTSNQDGLISSSTGFSASASSLINYRSTDLT